MENRRAYAVSQLISIIAVLLVVAGCADSDYNPGATADPPGSDHSSHLDQPDIVDVRDSLQEVPMIPRHHSVTDVAMPGQETEEALIPEAGLPGFPPVMDPTQSAVTEDEAENFMGRLAFVPPKAVITDESIFMAQLTDGNVEIAQMDHNLDVLAIRDVERRGDGAWDLVGHLGDLYLVDMASDEDQLNAYVHVVSPGSPILGEPTRVEMGDALSTASKVVDGILVISALYEDGLVRYTVDETGQVDVSFDYPFDVPMDAEGLASIHGHQGSEFLLHYEGGDTGVVMAGRASVSHRTYSSTGETLWFPRVWDERSGHYWGYRGFDENDRVHRLDTLSPTSGFAETTFSHLGLDRVEGLVPTRDGIRMVSVDGVNVRLVSPYGWDTVSAQLDAPIAYLEDWWISSDGRTVLLHFGRRCSSELVILHL